MGKIRINLLPREVLERRKAEQRLALMILGLVLMVGALALVFGVNYVRLSQEQANLEIIRTENQNVQARIKKIEDFAANKSAVEARESVVSAAVAGKYGWSRFLNNLSLIVPNEVWLTSLSVSKDGAVSISGSAYAGSASSGIGFEPVSKWLIHFAEMNDIGDIWLSSSAKSTAGAATTGPALGSAETTSSTVTVTFATTAKIKSLGAAAGGQ